MPFRLRHLQHNFELGQGEFAIGRSTECQLALDDPLVSRRHAVLIVGAESVVIKDLGSRNGVVVNGMRIDTSRILLNGDRIVIGSQEMTLVTWQHDPGFVRRRSRTGSQTLSSVLPARVVAPPGDPTSDISKKIDSFPLLSTLADKALALGRPEDAERILAALLAEILREVQNEQALPAEIVDQSAQYGVRLAAGTAKGAWVDYVITLYAALRRPCPATIVDELHSVLRKTSAVDLDALRTYVDQLRARASEYGPADRFLLQRIEGLVRLAALK